MVCKVLILQKKEKILKKFTQLFTKHRGILGGILFILLLTGSCWILSRKSAMVFLESHFTSEIAKLTAWLLNLSGMKVNASGVSVSGHGFGVDIKYGCNGIYEIIVFVAALIAYPLRIKDKIFGILIGIVSISILNILRVIILFLSGIYFPGVFKAIHENIAQNIFIFIMVILWIYWVSRSSSRTVNR